MLRQPLLLFFALAVLAAADRAMLSFVKDYFSYKVVGHAVIFGCWDLRERIKFFHKDFLWSARTCYQDIRENMDMKDILKVDYYRLGIFLDVDCPRSETVLSQFNDQRLPYNESYFWLLKTDGPGLPLDMLKDQPLTVETEMTLASRREDGTFLLYDVYNPSRRHGGQLNVSYMGYWKPPSDLVLDRLQYKYKRRQDFAGLTLNFSIALTNPPLPDFDTYLTTPINRHLDTMTRFHYALVLHLKDFYNFRMNLKRSTTWGYLINGTFNGILGDMIKGTVDVAATPFQFKPERIDVCEYTVQTFVARPCFIFRHPKSNNVRNVFLKPFAAVVWYLILLLAVVYWLTLLLTVKMELRYGHNERPKACTLDTNPASETAVIATAALCQQGLSDGPRVYSGRIVFLSLFLWALLLFQFYSASIVGSLLSEPPRFIKTLKHLTESDLEIGIEDIAYNYDHFATTTDPVARQMDEKKVRPKKKRKTPAYLPPAEGLENVRKGGYAFHVDVATAYKIISDTFAEDEICELQEVQLFSPRHIATITSKHSPFKKMVTYALRQMVEHGLTKRLRRVWHHERPQCPEGHSAKPVPVALNEFCPALFALLFGCALALGVMLAEMFAAQTLERRRISFGKLQWYRERLNDRFFHRR